MKQEAPPSPFEGWYTVYDISPDGVWIPRFRKRNTLMVSHGFAYAQLLGNGDRSYRISKLYVEFENTVGAVSEPSYSAFDSREYYDNLVAPKDYLRLDVLGAPRISIVPGYEAYFNAANGEGNRLTVTGQTSGAVGENGLEFSDAVNSRVYGLALVAAPQDGDKTKDILITRGYWTDGGDQAEKQASGQIAVSWDLDFKPV